MSNQAITMYKEREDIVPFLIKNYELWKSGRSAMESEWQKTQNMIFATDAAQCVGAEASSDWKNNSTRGKIAQIRDNLHANYSTAIFGNRNWIKWDAAGNTPDLVTKRKIITSYMRNKLELNNFEKVVSDLLYDYIDYGVAFASCSWQNREREVVNKFTGNKHVITEYVGPEAHRHSPHDIVINPTAKDIKSSPKFVRELFTLGEVLGSAEDMPYDEAYQKSINNIREIRKWAGGLSADDCHKDINYGIQGFGGYHAYLMSDTVEIITYHGDIVTAGGTLQRNRRVVIADRAVVLVNEQADPMPSGTFIKMAGWRDRPDNLYSQSPLAKLLGLQFRLDKLENIKADAMDLAVEPPLAISGEVGDFEWRPGEVIDVDIDGSITELGKNLNGVVTAQNEIAQLEQSMEEFAGAPKQAMGFRTPGEKTAFEVQSLETAGSRIFQQKVTKFEKEILEPLLNDMLNLAVVHMTNPEDIKVIDPDLNIEDFISVSSEDLIASGSIRAIGSRHFAAKAQAIQELSTLTQGGLLPIIQPHMSGKHVAALVNDLLELDKYDVFRPMAGVEETADIQAHASNLQEEMAVSSQEDVDLDEGDLAELGEQVDG